MAKYIPLDAVLAEIESLEDKGKYHEVYDFAYRDGNNGALYALKNKLDTIEVKEVDIEEEVESLIKSSIWRFADKEDFLRVAKHFFKLGLHCSQTDDSYIEGVKGSYTTTDKD